MTTDARDVTPARTRRPSPTPVLIVTGPTASGKSRLAAILAEALQGTIINADAMQCYREFRVLTARPTIAEEARLPHRLYGIRSVGDPATVAWWREAVLAAIGEARANGRLPILCGGTGLYLTSLVTGLSPIPTVAPAARAEARELLAESGPAALYARLAALDPATAARLRPSDSQRIVRAWEVLRSSGQGLAAWQSVRGEPAALDVSLLLLLPDRTALHQAIVGRFAAMLESGALDEVRALGARDPALPAMRAHGVPELSAYLAGRLTLDQAKAHAIVATMHYAKRQVTWIRHHPLAKLERTRTIRARISGATQFPRSDVQELVAFVKAAG